MKLSIVTTVYKSEKYIDEFYKKSKISAERIISKDIEWIFVNDGSPDSSLEVLTSLQKKDKRVTIVDLSKNFGHHHAIMAGLGIAKGEFIFLIDSDLEEDPALLEVFWEKLSLNKEIDSVYGVQKKRKGGALEKLSGLIAYKIINCLSSTPVVPNMIMARLMRKKYVEGLLQHKDKKISLINLFSATGFHQDYIYVKKKHKKETSYTFLKRFFLFVNSLVSFTAKPIYIIFYFGLLSVFLSIFLILFFIVSWMLGENYLTGWLSVIMTISFFGGSTLASLGIIGIYISIIFDEVKDRPRYLIKSIIRKK